MDRIAFTFFGIDIAWYGLLIAIGMMLGVLLAVKRARYINVSEEIVYDIALWTIPIGVIGARVYYVLFNLEYYATDWHRILQFRQGGLAIHGGIIAGFIAGYFICRKNKVRFLSMADVIAPSMVLGQAIGRWGNYFNQEAYGRPTELPWAITINGVNVHPTFFYEFLWNIGVLIVLLLFTKRKQQEGEVFFLYLVLYSLGRFFIEVLRIDSLMIGSIRTAQLTSILMMAGGLVAIWYVRKKSND